MSQTQGGTKMGDPWEENHLTTRKQNLACLTCDRSWTWTHSDEMTSHLDRQRLAPLTTQPREAANTNISHTTRKPLSSDMTKPTKWLCTQQRQISLGICPVWSESSLSAWRKLGSLATHWVYSEDSDQTGRMPRLIWVLDGHTVTLLVLSCRSSFRYVQPGKTQMSHVMRKPAFGFFDQVRFKAVCSLQRQARALKFWI